MMANDRHQNASGLWLEGKGVTMEHDPETVDGILSASLVIVKCPECGEQRRYASNLEDDTRLRCPACERWLRLDPDALAHLRNPHDGTPAQARKQESRTAQLYSSNVLSASSRVREAIGQLGGIESPTANAILRSLDTLRVLTEADTLLRAAISSMKRGRYDESAVPIPVKEDWDAK